MVNFKFVGWYLAMTVVMVLSLMPHTSVPSIFNVWDKLQHALAFTVLTVWALQLWPTWVYRVAIGMLAYGAIIEGAQWAVGWRFAEWSDQVANTVGVLFAVPIHHLMGRLRQI